MSCRCQQQGFSAGVLLPFSHTQEKSTATSVAASCPKVVFAAIMPELDRWGDLAMTRLPLAALCFGLACLATVGPAQAQFVCGGSGNGGEAQTGQGATASSTGVACGPGAAANGQQSVA